MRLLRRFSVAGKFMVIALLLVLPLSILVGGTLAQARAQVGETAAERQSLDLVGPLADLVAELCRERMATAAGVPAGDLGGAIEAVDQAERRSGRRLGLHAQWLALRGELTALTSGRRSADPAGVSPASAATEHAIGLLGQVAVSARLVVDSDLDSYYLT